ncbi:PLASMODESMATA CALLOSE-BINDING PROTEIN 3 [Nymphaea thermarum]|nr:PLASMODESMATA CALLOSE-BINDING PROTEIN 3 [Nymphaea thermarum]
MPCVVVICILFLILLGCHCAEESDAIRRLGNGGPFILPPSSSLEKKAEKRAKGSHASLPAPPYCIYPRSPPGQLPPLFNYPAPPPPPFYFPPVVIPSNPPPTTVGTSPPGTIPNPPGTDLNPPIIICPPNPPVFLPPVIYPAPSVPPPPPPPAVLWCVAKPAVPDPIIQEAVDYACGSGADCVSIQDGGPCFSPNTLLNHASFAFNSYWQRSRVAGGTCDFGGVAILINEDPSYDGCKFENY